MTHIHRPCRLNCDWHCRCDTPDTACQRHDAMDLNPAAARYHNGWRGVIEFPNGGRQILVTRYGTMQEAIEEADRALRLRLKYPDCAVRDPRPYECQDLEVKIC